MDSFFKNFGWKSKTVPGYHPEPEPEQESKGELERERNFFENQCRVLEEQVSVAKEISSDHAFCSRCALPELQRVIKLGESLIEGCQSETCVHKAYLRQDERTMAFEETLKEILWCMSVVFYSHRRRITSRNPSILPLLDEVPQAVLGAKEQYLMQKAAVADETVLRDALRLWIKRHKCSIEECGRPQKSSSTLCLADQILNRRASNGEGGASRGLAGESDVEGHHISLLWTTVQKSLNDVVQIGKGSFGTVFETKWLGDTYAKKEFDIHCKDFADEVNALAKLNHPHIVKVYAACSKSCIPCFFLMEKVAYNLRTLMKRRMSRLGMNPPFSISAGIDLMLQLSEAMSYMNSQGMVHRDLKAENILVNPVDDDSELCYEGFVIAKLADFGLTKVKNEVTSRMTRNTGTRLWMAPEMFGAHLDDEENLLLKVFPRKADVYSYGIVCSEILTGNVPYYNVSYKQGELYKLITDPGNPLRPELPDSCPEILASLIRKCWHTDPVERPTFEEISTTLRYFKGLLMIGGVSDLVHFGGGSWRMFTAKDQIAELKGKLEETKHARDGLEKQLFEAEQRELENNLREAGESKSTAEELQRLRFELDNHMLGKSDKEKTLASQLRSEKKILEQKVAQVEDEKSDALERISALEILLKDVTQAKTDLEDELEIVRNLAVERKAEDNETAQAEYRSKTEKLEEQVLNLKTPDAPSHVIFIIDNYFVGATYSLRPTMEKFTQAWCNGLGCVYEAILRFIKRRTQLRIQDLVSVILFSHDTTCVAVQGRPIAESIVDHLLQFEIDDYNSLISSSLQGASSILKLSVQRGQMQNKTPVMIFISVGEKIEVHDDPVTSVKRLKEVYSELILHTFRFGSTANSHVLLDMASAGYGCFFDVSLNPIQLAESFEMLANSLTQG